MFVKISWPPESSFVWGKNGYSKQFKSLNSSRDLAARTIKPAGTSCTQTALRTAGKFFIFTF